MVGRNKYHAAVIKKHGAENILVGKIECSTESIAFDLEVGLIKCLKRMGVRLSNMSSGGEGSSGIPASEKQRMKMREINASFSAEQRISARLKEPADTNIRRSETMKAKWQQKTEEEKKLVGAKVSANNYISWSDPEVRERRITGMQGKKKTMTPAAIEARRNNAAKRILKGTKS